MTEQPTALRLADRCEKDAQDRDTNYGCRDSLERAAAELRRLAEMEDEWMALSQDQGKLEGQIDRLMAQRDALLEACKTLVALPGTEDWVATLRLAVEQARAAIKAVEEGK